MYFICILEFDVAFIIEVQNNLSLYLFHDGPLRFLWMFFMNRYDLDLLLTGQQIYS